MLDNIISGAGITISKVLPDMYFKELYPKIECADGTTLSVQASETHYCTPRDNFGPYTHVEVGFPSVPPPNSWMQYFDGEADDDPCGSVYGNITVELVREFVELHGGEIE